MMSCDVIISGQCDAGSLPVSCWVRGAEEAVTTVAACARTGLAKRRMTSLRTGLPTRLPTLSSSCHPISFCLRSTLPHFPHKERFLPLSPFLTPSYILFSSFYPYRYLSFLSTFLLSPVVFFSSHLLYTTRYFIFSFLFILFFTPI
jgi:hypothetical protein